MPRPTRLTAKTSKAILSAIESGMFAKDACALVDLREATFYDWVKRGNLAREQAAAAERGDRDEHDEPIAPPEKSERRFIAFVAAVEKAAAKSTLVALKRVRAGVRGWQGSAWFLERRDRDAWGRRWQLDSNVNHSGTVTAGRPERIEIVLASPPELTDGTDDVEVAELVDDDAQDASTH